MDQPKIDKFSELSPVLELVYVMLTNMAKYIEVYATDIEAEKLEQYTEARDALKNAIAKFDVLYGLQSLASASLSEETVKAPEVTAVAQPQEAPVEQNVAPAAPSESQTYEFASGNDPESLKKAKQAVEELKTLFADMKKQESVSTTEPVAMPAEAMPTPEVTQPVPMAETVPSVNPNMPMPTFVTPPTQPVPEAASSMPTPMNTPSAAQDATEIDSILAELKNLQNKGTQQL